ncbi:hypothetical protein P2G88_02350 [Aliiglaciecola sp. CAU 1673]|uniref:DUF6942 family protein n=1 Tax=Aliiglaciecola sp. CAU 1673 TaxID=3032595 RepID=UPI0023DCC3F9|nr:hypothetical protein [Aliiglaciecola sp. CAU 1673]MDF2177085.1 hypothetical protein [Aliiglaciecola sp. CAU 1673]
MPMGLGCSNATLNVYVANPPPVWPLPNKSGLHCAQPGELESIIQQCGNGWRKLFSIYAKLVFSLAAKGVDLRQNQPNWQDYKTKLLLQPGSATALYFDANKLQSGQIKIIAGRQHARVLDKALSLNLRWLDHEFALCEQKAIVVCPFFDYRQLTNEKIERLSTLIISLLQVQSEDRVAGWGA